MPIKGPLRRRLGCAKLDALRTGSIGYVAPVDSPGRLLATSASARERSVLQNASCELRTQTHEA